MSNTKIAYLIAAHSDLTHLKRLISSLDYNATFFIHLDKRSSLDYHDVFFLRENIVLISKKDSSCVFWGGFSQVETTVKLINKCLNFAETNNFFYKKIVFLSGSCYPIKSNLYIHSYFEKNKDINFIRAFDLTNAEIPRHNFQVKKHNFFNFHFINNTITRVTRKILFFSFYFHRKKNYYLDGKKKKHIFHGSSWWAVNHDVLNHFRQESDLNRSLNDYFKNNCMSSDEKYFHTIFFNSHFSSTNKQVGIEDATTETSDFANIHIIDKSLTKWFDDRDYNEIINSDKLFVRKTSSAKSIRLLDMIDVTRNIL